MKTSQITAAAIITIAIAGLIIYWVSPTLRYANTFIKADEYVKKGDFENAARLYADASSKDPDNIKYYIKLAEIYTKTKDMPKLKKTFEGGLKADGKNKYFLVNAGWMEFQSKEYAKAEERFRKAAEEDPKNPKIHFMHARALQEQGKHKEALSAFNKALQYGFDSKRCYLNIALIYEYGLHDYENALINYDKYIESGSDPKISAKIKDFKEWSRGEKLESEGKYRQAADEYERALQNTPDSVALYSRLGRACRKAGDYPRSERAYLKALSKHPDNYYILNNLGSLYYDLAVINDNAERYDNAEACWKDAIKKAPSKPNAYFNLGSLYAKKRMYGESEAYYLKAKELGYDSTEVAMQLYWIHYNFTKNQKKTKEYERELLKVPSIREEAQKNAKLRQEKQRKAEEARKAEELRKIEQQKKQEQQRIERQQQEAKKKLDELNSEASLRQEGSGQANHKPEQDNRSASSEQSAKKENSKPSDAAVSPEKKADEQPSEAKEQKIQPEEKSGNSIFKSPIDIKLPSFNFKKEKKEKKIDKNEVPAYSAPPAKK